MELLRELALGAATLTMGLVAGLFYVFSHAVMPGLGRTDDRTFVAAFQGIDLAISNPWHGASFIGAPTLTLLVALENLRRGGGWVAAWGIAALLLYLTMLAITVRVHLPLNRQVQAAGSPDAIANLAAVRERFERRWVRWNIARAAASLGAFACLVVALAQ